MGYVFKTQEELYLMGAALAYYRILMSFKALRADLGRKNKVGYKLYLKALNEGLKWL